MTRTVTGYYTYIQKWKVNSKEFVTQMLFKYWQLSCALVSCPNNIKCNVELSSSKFNFMVSTPSTLMYITPSVMVLVEVDLISIPVMCCKCTVRIYVDRSEACVP